MIQPINWVSMLLYTLKFYTKKNVLYVFIIHPVDHRTQCSCSITAARFEEESERRGLIIKIDKVLWHKCLSSVA